MKYKIYDVWMALELVKKVFIYEIVAIAVFLLVANAMLDEKSTKTQEISQENSLIETFENNNKEAQKRGDFISDIKPSQTKPETKQNDNTQVTQKNTQIDHGTLFPLYCVIFVYFFQFILVYRANSVYIIDEENFTFPRSDIENSLLSIITFAPFWGLFFRKTIQTSDIENTYIDTQRDKKPHFFSKKKQTYYNLNVLGSFGSANLAFKSRQKRDEVRNAIAQCVKRRSGKKVDRAVSEF